MTDKHIDIMVIVGIVGLGILGMLVIFGVFGETMSKNLSAYLIRFVIFKKII